MKIDSSLIFNVIVAVGTAMVISFAATPVVKAFAVKVNAIDVPTDSRRVHDHPIPRMGGLAIFLGFLISIVLFANITKQVQGILLGSIVIIIIGVIDDILRLKAWIKLLGQIAAAGIAVAHGIVVEIISHPMALGGGGEYLTFGGVIAIIITFFWIVGMTNAVNLIDGLDGLAVGISAISSITMLVVAMMVSEGNVAVILAALAGGCFGFMPFNLNPAKIFMGDTGALLLGYVLSTVSVIGFFKFYAVISFAVPILAMALPLLDTLFAIIRRTLKGQNPMAPDRGHFHHRLLDMGLSHKQAVAILYAISAVLGLTAVVITTESRVRTVLFIVAMAVAVGTGVFITAEVKKHGHWHRFNTETPADTEPQSKAEEEKKDEKD